MILKNLILKLSIMSIMFVSFTQQTVVISMVTNDPYRQNNYLTGSVNGGTTLYIDGSGFDEETYLNKVFVGDYDCVVDDYYTSESQLVCTMPRQFYSVQKDLRITVEVKGTTYQCTQGDCTMNLELRYTPTLYSIVPQAANPGDEVSVCGVFRTDWTKDLKEIRISGRNCILTEEQLEENRLSYWGHTCLSCQLPDDIENGNHTLTVTSSRGTGFDNPLRQSQGFTVGFESETYNVRILPHVSGVNSNEGYLGGQFLELEGKNFGSDLSKVSVKVEDVNCRVVSVANTKIKCELENLAAVPTNVAFRGGAGLRNRIYNGNNRNFQSWWNSDPSEIRYDRIALSTENFLDEDQYAQKMYGIFKSQEAGEYTFKISGDDQIRLMISKNPIDFSTDVTWDDFEHDLDAEGNPNEVVNRCEVYGWTDFRDFYDEKTQFCKYTLQANTEYYLYVMHTEGGGGDTLSIGVIIPNTDETKINRTPHTQQIKIPNEPVRQQWAIKVYGATSGAFKLRWTQLDPDTGKMTYNRTTSAIGHDSSAEYVSERIRRAIGTRSTAERVPLDGNGNQISNENLAEGYQWNITFTSHRSKNVAPFFQFDDETFLIPSSAKYSVEVTQEQSNRINGQFVVSYQGHEKTIKTDWSYHTVKSKLSDIPPLSQGVSVYTTGNRYDGYAWHVVFDSITGQADDLVIVSSEITGGNPDLDVQAVVDTTFEMPTLNLVYLPMPSDFIRTVYPTPQITVEVNETLASCDPEKCNYSFIAPEETPTIESFSRAQNEITINLKSGHNLVSEDGVTLITDENAWVKFANSKCEISSINLPEIKCLLPTNADGSVYLEAGSHSPIVHLEGKGYFKLDDSEGNAITPEVVPLVISSISPTAGSLGGGTILTLNGSGFSAKNEFSELGEITVDGQPCEILSELNQELSSNTKMFCKTPEKENSGSRILESFAAGVSATVNGVTEVNNSFSYDTDATPYITTLSPDNSSPVLKADLTINGQNFGTDANKLQVLMKSIPANPDDEITEYLCNVFETTDTSLTCRLSGGKSGTYALTVVKEGIGYSLPTTQGSNLFKYELLVTSVSPTSGSVEGGTIVTITGKNFSTVELENQVVVGVHSDFCIIQSATTTEIVCKMNKPTSSSIQDLSQELDLKVVGRAQEIASGDLKFKFDAAITPIINSVSPTDPVQGNTVELTGSGFPTDGTPVHVELGDNKIETVVVNGSGTVVSFTMPGMPFGSLVPKVYINGIGYATYGASPVLLESALLLTNVTPNSGAKYGHIITISGNGFEEDIVTPYIDDKECEVISVTFNEIKCRTPYSNKYDQDFNVILKYEDPEQMTQQITCNESQVCSFHTVNPYPNVTEVSVEADPDNADNSLVLFTGNKIKDNGLSGDDQILYDAATVVASLTPVNLHSSFSQTGPVNYLVSNSKLTLTKPVAGVFYTNYFIEEIGFATKSPSEDIVEIAGTVDEMDPTSSSLVGGTRISLTGSGFPPLEHKELVTVRVCGVECEIIESSYDALTCLSPALNTKTIQSTFNLESPKILRNAVVDGDRTHSNMSKIIDGDINTYYYGHGNNECFVKLDYGENVVIHATQIRMFPRVNSREYNLIGGSLQGSMDGETWTTLVEIDNSLVENWNLYKPEVGGDDWEFRYLKFSGAQRDCQIAELEVTGYQYVNIPNFNMSGENCDLSVTFNGSENSHVQSTKVTYDMTTTAEVSGISPKMGTTVGGTEVTITGTKFASDSKVFFDEIECVVSSATSTEIVCTTGDRPEFTESTMRIESVTKGKAATHGHVFLYIDRWSDPATWGGETPPRSGDSIHVPKGQILLVDVYYIDIYAMIIEGTVIFAYKEDMEDIGLTEQQKNEKVMEFHAWFIYVNKGRLQIGMPDARMDHKLTFTMYGSRYSKTLPGFGNKGIFVQDGSIDIHGEERDKTWTTLASSANAGDTSITLSESVDWRVGEEIIITPTSRNRDEVEERVIKSISGTTIELDRALDFGHFSGIIDGYDPQGQDGPIELRGEVALLTRNLRVRGDPSTEETEHGSHILIRGKEGQTFGRVSYIETFLAGQKFQLGRYPIHFHMIGHVHDMYVKGNAVHHTFNRGTTIHGVHYLTVEDNVYYRTMGHTIFLEDGIETNNVIQRNLVCHVSPAPSLLMSDMDPSGLWQARPTNFIRNNVFVGSAGNGVWFELVGKPTGPSKVDGICPKHDHLVQYDNNIHHSNSLGLRVYPVYLPLSKPCDGYPNITLRDPWAGNPAMPAYFKDNLMYMNGLGTFGKQIGGVVYKDITLVSNSTNQTFFKPNAHETLTRIEGGISIGESDISTFHGLTTGRALGIGQKDGFLVKNVRFYNFNNGFMFSLCASCRSEMKRVPGGVRTNWINNRFENVTVPILQFSNALYDKDVQYDYDGSLIKQFPLTADQLAVVGTEGGWITAYFKHLDNDHCIKFENPEGGDRTYTNYPLAICNKNIALLRLKKTVLDNASLLYGQDLKLFKLGPKKDGDVDFNFDMNVGDDESTPEVNESDDRHFGIMKFRNCYLTKNWRGWISLVATSYEYNYHFGWGVEWKKMKIENDYQWGLKRDEPIDLATWDPLREITKEEKPMERKLKGLPEINLPELATYMRHNHTEHRELFDNWFTGLDHLDATQSQLLNTSLASAAELKADTTKFGDFFYDADNETINWKIDQKQMGAITSEGIYCRDFCPKEEVAGDDIERDPQMNWDDVAAWKTTNKVPEEGDEVVIESSWNIRLNVATPKLKSLKILGRLEFASDVDDLVINSRLIDIGSTGELLIGTKASPHTRKAQIFIEGKKSDDDVVITPGIPPVNKAIVNKGKFKAYGVAPNVISTRLVKKIQIGDTNFFVANDNYGWAVGDELVIAATKNSNDRTEDEIIDFKPEFEKVKILEIVEGASETEIKIALEGDLANGFQHFHYGSNDTITTTHGVLDMRAEVVNLTRNVSVTSDLTDSWGCTIITPMYLTETENGYGWIELSGVEIQNCGQRDTKKAAIDINFAKGPAQLIEKCSFNESQGWAFNTYASKNIKFDNNVVFNARKNAIFIQDSEDVEVTNNVVIGVKQRENYDNVEYWDVLTGIYYNDTTPLKERNVKINHNIVSGSPWFGFVVPGYILTKDGSANDETADSETENSAFFFNNTAHNNRGGWFAGNLTDDSYHKFSHFTAYKNWEQGFVNRQDAQNVYVKNFLLSDNTNGITINAAGSNSRIRGDPQVQFTDSTIIGKALDDCAECYQGNDNCETSGFYSALFNGSPYDFYFEKTRMPFHNSTSHKFTQDGIQKLNNLTFKNFNVDENCNNRSFALRMNNFYQDNTNAIYMEKINLENVDDVNKFFFANHKRHLNTPVYCGKRDCTGNYNTPFYDLDGSIFDKPMTFFGNNKGAGRDGECTFFEDWNGHACNPEYAQLMFDIPRNDAKIVFMPATLRRIDYTDDISDSLKFEHETDSPSRVTNLIRLRHHTHIEFAGTMHSGIQYEMLAPSGPGGDANDWAIIRVRSENPATMTVYVNNGKRVMHPTRLSEDDVSYDMIAAKGKCGSNTYNHDTKTLDFLVLSGNCTVKVEFTNALQVNMVLDIDPQNLTDDMVTTVVDALSATLGISIDRIRVVGVRRKNKKNNLRVLEGTTSNSESGSSELVFEILDENPVTEKTDTQEESVTEFNNFKDIINQGLESGSLDVGAPVLNVDSNIKLDESEEEIENALSGDTTTDNNTNDNGDSNGNGTGDDSPPSVSGGSKTGLIVGLCVGIPAVIAIIALAVWCFMKKGKTTTNNSNVNKTDQTNDNASGRDLEMNNFVVNNAGLNTFGKHGNIKFAKKMVLADKDSKLDSYIKRKD